MKPLRILGTIVFAICAVSATVWATRYAPWVAQKRPDDSRTVKRVRAAQQVKSLNAGVVPESLDTSLTGAVDSAPPVATKEPLPILETEKTVFDFGTAMINTEGRRKFRIENKGQGQLLVAKGPVECSCIIS